MFILCILQTTFPGNNICSGDHIADDDDNYLSKTIKHSNPCCNEGHNSTTCKFLLHMSIGIKDFQLPNFKLQLSQTIISISTPKGAKTKQMVGIKKL